jgi:hypothetical protein
MPVLVTIRSGDAHRTIEADGLERDRLLPGNLVLTGTRNLALSHPGGGDASAYLWSVPDTLVVSYAMIKARAPEPQPEQSVTGEP